MCVLACLVCAWRSEPTLSVSVYVKVMCALACFRMCVEVRANFVSVSAVILSEGMAPPSALSSKGKWQKSFYHAVSLEELSDPTAVKTSFCRLCFSSCIPITQRVTRQGDTSVLCC